MPRSRPTLRRPALAAAVLVACAGSAVAQSSRPIAVPSDTRTPSRQTPPSAPADTRPPDAAPAALGGAELSDSLFRWEPLALAMRLPAGSVAQATRMGDRAAVQIAPPPPDDTWVINIQAPRTSNQDATIAEAVDKTIAQISEAFGITNQTGAVVESKARIIERIDTLNLAGGPAARFYVSLPQGDGSSLVKGYTIFKPGPTQYAVFELITPEASFPKTRIAYEMSVATAAFEDAQSVNLSRGGLIEAGQRFLSGLGPDDYAAVLDGKEVWHRLYTPAPTGAPIDAKEHGYRGLRFFKGRKSELGATTSSGVRSERGDNAEGYLVSLRARLLIDEGKFIDSDAMYFMTPDREEEVWTVTMVVKSAEGRTLGTASETGVRAGTQLVIAVEESGREGREIRPPVPRGYVSQVDTFLLPRLLLASRIETTVGSYAYQSTSESVPFRKDTLKRLTGAGGEGLWTVETQFREDQPAQTTTYASDGQLLRTELSDGRVWEQTDLDALLRIWRSKGLPTGK